MKNQTASDVMVGFGPVLQGFGIEGGSGKEEMTA